MSASRPPWITPPLSTPLSDEIIERLDDAFAAAKDPDKVGVMEAYMRNQFPFLGIPTTARVAACRAATAATPPPSVDDCVALAQSLWDRNEREYQYAAEWYLRRHIKRLPSDFLPVARELITTKSWWDTVDGLAQHVVGELVRADRSLSAVMDEWITSPNIWLARTAIIHQERWKGETDVDRLFRYCLLRSGDTEFFIRKAIGWALREYSKTDERAVRRFVADHADVLSGLSAREALKWLDRRARVDPCGGDNRSDCPPVETGSDTDQA